MTDAEQTTSDLPVWQDPYAFTSFSLHTLTRLRAWVASALANVNHWKEFTEFHGVFPLRVPTGTDTEGRRVLQERRAEREAEDYEQMHAAQEIYAPRQRQQAAYEDELDARLAAYPGLMTRTLQAESALRGLTLILALRDRVPSEISPAEFNASLDAALDRAHRVIHALPAETDDADPEEMPVH